MFALRNVKTGELMGFYASGSEGEFCVDVEFSLSELNDNVWVTYSRERAEFVANNDTPWYSAGSDSPRNEFYVGKLEVVELSVK